MTDPEKSVNIFDSLEVWRIDPALSRVFTMIREANRGPLEQPVTVAAASEISAQINEEWLSAISASCKFTGIARFQNPDRPQDEDEYRSLVETLEVSDCEGEEMVFYGAYPMPADRDPTGPDDEILFELQLAFKKNVKDQDGQSVEVPGVCDVDSVVRLEFDHRMSIERATALLQIEQPDLLEAIDSAVYDDDDASPTDQMMALSGLHLDTAGMDEESIDMTRKALTVYTNSVVGYDRILPHILRVAGPVKAQDSNGDYVYRYVQNGEVYAIAKDIIWKCTPEPDSQNMVPQLVVDVYDEDLEQAPHGWIVPISSIQGLYSTRYEFFNRES